jgi:RNA polymerase sigma-54 factor
MQRLSQQQRLSLRLSPQQIQLLKLIQVPTAQLEERIKEEVEENPALEQGEAGEDKTDDDIYGEDAQEIKDENEDYLNENTSNDEFENLDLSDYTRDDGDDGADYNFRDDGYNDDDEPSNKNVVRVETSFVEELFNQLNLLDLTPHEYSIAEHIIGSIDDDGYLRREITAIVDDLSFRQNIQTTDAEVMRLVDVIQQFEPAGIGARTLQECLHLQLVRKTSSPNVSLALRVVDKYFEEITKKHYTKIQRSLNVSDEQFKEIIHIITGLDPKPGGSIQGSALNNNYIIPDFFIFNNAGRLELTLNARNAPELRLSSNYKDMLRDYEKKRDPKQKDAISFIKQKLDGAKWFIDAIRQRQNTLMLTMDTIMKYQEEFFLSGDDSNLKPMILKDIAQRTGLDISTISRVVNSKYVQTEYGTFSLRYFFSEGLSTDSGDEVSTREVKNALQEIIDAEDKKEPITDEDLATQLQKKGYNIARRTIAKYREQLNIPVARLRKEL